MPKTKDDYRVITAPDGSEKTQVRVGNMWSTVTNKAARSIKDKFGVGGNIPKPTSSPRASQEVMDIRMATRPNQHGGAVPSPIGNAYNAMTGEQKKQFQHADAGGQDRIAKSLVPQPPKTVQPPRTAISSASVPRSSVPTPYGQLSPNQINTEAQNRLDRERAALKTAAEEKLANLRNNANYANQLIKDQRVLDNLMFARQNDPSNGRTEYMATNIQRGRDIDDTFRNANLTASLNAVEQDLYNFDKLAPERQQALINEMTRLERQYGLEVGNLTGNFNGQRTLAGQTADRNYGLGLAGLSGQLPGGGQTLAAQKFGYQRERDELADTRYDEERDYQQEQDRIALTGFLPDGTPTNAMQQQQLETAWNTINQIGYVPANLAEIVGVPAGTKTMDAQQIAISRTNAATSATNAETSRTNSTQNRLMDIWRSSGKAPEGIPGVAPGTPYYDPVAARDSSETPQIDPKESADNLTQAKQYVNDLNYDQAIQYAQGIKDYVSDSDYRALLNHIDNEFN